MTERERLIGIIRKAEVDCANTIQCEACEHCGKGEQCQEELIADYLLANGVIVPPCRVGDTVYWYNMGGELTEAEVKMISVSVRHSKGYEYNVRFEDFGKTVFHSRKLAEEALNEQEKL